MEGRRVFAELTVDENLTAGAFTVRDRNANGDAYERVMELFPPLQPRRRHAAGYLSGGEQQMLAIGRALMADPKLLILDEPSLGLAPMLIEQIRDIIVDINADGVSVLLIEQNAMMALSIADYGYVMESGKDRDGRRTQEAARRRGRARVLPRPSRRGRAPVVPGREALQAAQALAVMTDSTTMTDTVPTTTTDAVRSETTDVVPTTTTDAVPSETTDAQPLLQVDDISLRFGGVTAIDSVSFEVRDGELFAIIGPNGAGKTSIFNSISQVYQPQSGDIRWKGTSIMGTRPDRVARLGVARTFQNIELFPQMTVLDNLLTGRHIRMSGSFLAGAVWVGKAKREEIEHRRQVEDIIDFWRSSAGGNTGCAAALRDPEAGGARAGLGHGTRTVDAR